MRAALVVFDLDGVLVDSALGIRGSVDVSLAGAGLARLDDGELASLLGPPIRNGLGQILERRRLSSDLIASIIDGLVDTFRSDYADRSLLLTQVFPGIESSMDVMASRGHRLALATSKPRLATVALLDHFGLARRLDPVGCPVDVAHDTKTDVLARVLEQTVQPAGPVRSRRRVVMIGDRWHDMCAARELGCRAIGVLWGYGTPDELADAGADVIVEAPGDLAAAIEELLE